MLHALTNGDDRQEEYMSPRNFLYVRGEVEKVIRLGCEASARRDAVSFVDEWAAKVIAAHIGTQRFPLRAQAELTVAASEGYFGILGWAPNQPPEVSRWVSECNWLMKDRARFWADLAGRFRSSSAATHGASIYGTDG